MTPNALEQDRTGTAPHRRHGRALVMHFVWVEVSDEMMRVRAISSSGAEIDSVDITR